MQDKEQQQEPLAHKGTLSDDVTWTATQSHQEPSVGQQLRKARELAGISVEALSVQLKVSVRNLESIENNSWDDLPDFVYTRALIASICRHLKLDTRQMLQGVPLPAGPTRLLPQPAVDLSKSGLPLPDVAGVILRLKGWLWVIFAGAALAAAAVWSQENFLVFDHAVAKFQQWTTAVGQNRSVSAQAEQAIPTAPLAPGGTAPGTELPQEQFAPTPVPAGHVVQEVSPGGR